jgi:hypothetical protein
MFLVLELVVVLVTGPGNIEEKKARGGVGTYFLVDRV